MQIIGQHDALGRRSVINQCAAVCRPSTPLVLLTSDPASRGTRTRRLRFMSPSCGVTQGHGTHRLTSHHQPHGSRRLMVVKSSLMLNESLGCAFTEA